MLDMDSDSDVAEQSIFEPRAPITYCESEYAAELTTAEEEALANGNLYVRNPIDLNETKQIIDEHIENNSDPFDERLQMAFLEQQVQFSDYLNELDSCQMVNVVRMIRPMSRLTICDRKFDVKTIVGKGKYGTVFR